MKIKAKSSMSASKGRGQDSAIANGAYSYSYYSGSLCRDQRRVPHKKQEEEHSNPRAGLQLQ